MHQHNHPTQPTGYMKEREKQVGVRRSFGYHSIILQGT